MSDEATVALRVSQYIAVRDKLKAMDEEYENSVKPLKALQETLSGWLLQALDKTGSEAIKTEHGTCYATVRTSASLADAEAFMNYVIANNAWHLLDRRANATACKDYVVEHKAPPPGVNLSSMKTVGVRRK